MPPSMTAVGGVSSGSFVSQDGDADPTDQHHGRSWLHTHYRRQLSLLDKFVTELNNATTSRRLVARKTIEFFKHVLGSVTWTSAAQILSLLKVLGHELHHASRRTANGGATTPEPAIGNVVRRIMAAVREEAVRSDQLTAGDDRGKSLTGGGSASDTTTTTNKGESGRLSLQTMLWALPEPQTKGSSVADGVHGYHRSASHRDVHQRQESVASEAELQDYPAAYYQNRPELKIAVMEAITEIVTDLEDLHKLIDQQATNHIHDGEVILTCGRSASVQGFLLAAAAKKRNFSVLVAEGAPTYGGHVLARALASAGIATTLIADAAVMAVMARVHKVLLPAFAVLANGGLVAPCSGASLLALAAHHSSVPTICVTGMYKLCPRFPHEGQDTLNDLQSPASILDYASQSANPRLRDVEVVNPVHDYIAPEHIRLYVTNVGSYQPNFIYRLLAEYYHPDDWDSFE